MISSLLLSALLGMGEARAELSPAEDEPGFRIYDIIKPLKPGDWEGGGDDEGGGDAGSGGGARATRSGVAAAAATPTLYGKLLVVGKDDLVIGTSTWEAGSNYWFWSPNPRGGIADPCAGTPRAELEGPANPPDFALTLALDGTLTAVAARAAAGKDGALPGTTCTPAHAHRGPSRTFKANTLHDLAARLVSPDGQLYRMSVVREGETWEVGYGYHAPGAKSFSDSSRFGWILEVEGELVDRSNLPKLAGRGAAPSQTIYRIVSDHPQGIVDLKRGEHLVFERLSDRPASVRGLSTIDLLINTP